MSIQVRPLAYALGAEITGVDASKPLAPGVVREIREAWLKHQVLVFPGQDISMAEHVAFSRNFGDLELHPFKSVRNSEHPEIFEVTNKPVNGKPSGTGDLGREWHSDGAFTVRPPTGSFLHCRERPPVGGDTWFCNMYMAYDRLSDKLKSIVDQLEVVNDVAGVDITRNRDPAKVAEELAMNPPVVQPMVRTHSETGRKALFLNECVTRSIYGMSAEESDGLLKYLFQHSIRAEFTFRQTWKVHDIVLWDNRCTMHLAPRDYDMSQIRRMCRTTLIGDPIGRLLRPGDKTSLVSAA